jgi:hypothetical protein
VMPPLRASVPVHSSAFLPLLTSGQTFFIVVLDTDIVGNFYKHIQKAHFQAVLDIF